MTGRAGVERHGTITEKQTADAARQLLYHKERIEWMRRKLVENEDSLRRHLLHSGDERAILPGGYTLELSADGGLSVGRLLPDSPYEQLALKV